MMVAVPMGSAFRIKGCFEDRELRTETAHHIFQHVIPPDAQPLANELHVGVAVTQMPGKARQIARSRSRYFDQRLGFRDDAHMRAAFKLERVAITQLRGQPQVEQIAGALLADENDTAPVPVLRIEHDRVRRGSRVPLACTLDGGNTLHASEQEIALRHGQNLGRCAGQKLTVGAHFVCFGIDFDRWRGAVVNHILLADRARLLDCNHVLLDA